MTNYTGIAGKRILITGATSGLGLAMTQALVKAGARVLITGRDRNKVDKAVAAVECNMGECVGALVDVRDEHSIENGVAEMRRLWGGIDVLINNAGIGMQTVNPVFLTESQPFWKVSAIGFRELVDTNLTGYFLMAKAVVPYFLQAGGGRIINIDVSDQTKRRKGFVPYGPSRAASESLSHIMAQDLAEYGVTVNLLQPGGGTVTGMVPEEFKAKVGAQFLSPDVMAEPALFLCSDEAAGLNDAQIIAKDFAEWKARWKGGTA